MKLIRTTSILAGLLFVAASASTTGCSKKDEDKKGAKSKPNKDKPKDQQKDVKKDAKKDTTPTAGKVVAKAAADKPATSSGAGYTIKLARARKPGDKYKLTSKGKSSLKITQDGKPLPQSKEYTWDYEAEVTVKAVSAKGESTAEDHKVIKLEITAKGATKTPIAKDAVVVATVKDGKEHFAVDGKPLGRKVRAVLKDIVNLDDGDGIDEEKVFGTADKKKVGDSWDVNVKDLVASWEAKFKGSALPLKAENITGKVTLAGDKEMNGIKALQLTMIVTMKNVAPPMGPVKAEKGDMTVSLEGWIPQDPASNAGNGGTKKMTMHIEGAVGAAKIVTDMLQESTDTQTAMK